MALKQNDSLSEIAYKEIKEKILNGIYRPGLVLNEGELADILEMSRQPVRIAIHRLYEDGWLVGNSRRRIRVKAICEDDVREIYGIRKLLEIQALKEIFTKEKTWEYSFALEAIILRMRENIHSQLSYAHHDLDFHSYFITIFENSRWEKFFYGNREEIFRINMLDPREDVDNSAWIDGLMEMVSCIRSKDYPGAEAIYMCHLLDGYEKNMASLKNILIE